MLGADVGDGSFCRLGAALERDSPGTTATRIRIAVHDGTDGYYGGPTYLSATIHRR